MAPSTQTAVVVTDKGNVELKKIAVQKPGEGEILVKVVAAALNPTDWKSAKFLTKPGAVSGCDLAGVVEQLGPGVEGVKVGDRVATFLAGGRTPNGAFSEYAVAKAHFCIALPDFWTFEQGAQVPVAIYTTFRTFYESHDLPKPSAAPSESIPLLVYGASSVVGLYVLQVAKATGFKTYALCSPKNFQLVKSFGADEVYDYRDPEAPSKIKSASGGKITAAIDTISENGSVNIIVPALSSEGAKIANIVPYTETDKAALGSKYTAQFSFGYDLIVDRDITNAPSSILGDNVPSRLGNAAGYAKLAGQLLASGQVKPTPIRVWERGLEGINEAFQYSIEGKISGEKIIFRIADTPGLA